MNLHPWDFHTVTGLFNESMVDRILSLCRSIKILKKAETNLVPVIIHTWCNIIGRRLYFFPHVKAPTTPIALPCFFHQSDHVWRRHLNFFPEGMQKNQMKKKLNQTMTELSAMGWELAQFSCKMILDLFGKLAS